MGSVDIGSRRRKLTILPNKGGSLGPEIIHKLNFIL